MAGLCECGCGQPTTISPATVPQHGYVKGRHRRFVRNHDKRKGVLSTYRRVYGNHSSGTRLHRIRAERALGKPLPAGAVVHHADGSQSDDAPLVICQDQGYHRFLHARMRVQQAGGNPNTDAVCERCHGVKSRTEFRPNASAAFGVRVCLACSPRQIAARG